MLSKLLFGPARLGLSLTRATLIRSGKLAEGAAGLVVGVARSRFTTDPPASAARERSTAAKQPMNGATVTPASPVAVSSEASPAAAPASAPLERKPDVVAPDELPDTPLTHEQDVAKPDEDEDEVVAQRSEPGAEEGAGAELHFDAPWEGYDGDDVESVTARIATANPAELALVELYEQAHRQREAVRQAAERRMEELTSPPAGD